MHLFYYKDPKGNFGDDLNPWLWPRLFPKPIKDCFDEQTLFIGIGSVLSSLHIPSQPPKKVVFGAGAGYGPPPIVNDPWRIYCVRGPLTASALGLPEATAITDAAVLTRRLVAPADKPKHKVSFMPHHKTALLWNWELLCSAFSVHYLDPAAPVETTLDGIRSSELVITEAMHGAIVADALRVPHIPIRTAMYIQDFKWQDWAASVGIDHEFESFPAMPSLDSFSERMLWLIRHGQRRLSPEPVFQGTYRRLEEALERLIDAA